MNKAMQAIATTMIIILILALIYIFLSYYKNNDAIDTIVYPSGDSDVSSLEIPNGDYINDEEKNSGLSGNQSLIESIISNNPELKSDNIEVADSGDKNTEHSGDESITSEEKITSDGKNNENKGNSEVDIVIISEPQTSNQEKQEVLAEIDKALQGLLEAVSKVEIVDETRLDASLNSEVDKP